jgi:glycerate kinase
MPSPARARRGGGPGGGARGGAHTGPDLVVTGEGHLDPPSFAGKVPGGVVALVAGRCPVLCIVGDADEALLRSPPPGLEIISLAGRFGATRARSETTDLVAEVTDQVVRRPCP